MVCLQQLDLMTLGVFSNLNNFMIQAKKTPNLETVLKIIPHLKTVLWVRIIYFLMNESHFATEISCEYWIFHFLFLHLLHYYTQPMLKPKGF